MNYRVVFSPEAENHLIALYDFIATAASPEIAVQYVEAIISYCENMMHIPHRGTMRVMFVLAYASPTTKNAQSLLLMWITTKFLLSPCSMVGRTTKRYSETILMSFK
jgi:plasmid stabilization system protein ParE